MFGRGFVCGPGWAVLEGCRFAACLVRRAYSRAFGGVVRCAGRVLVVGMGVIGGVDCLQSNAQSRGVVRFCRLGLCVLDFPVAFVDAIIVPLSGVSMCGVHFFSCGAGCSPKVLRVAAPMGESKGSICRVCFWDSCLCLGALPRPPKLSRACGLSLLWLFLAARM